MSEQDTPMDALDRRLAAYLQSRAEKASAFGPGPDRIAASIAAGGRRGALQGGRGGPALRWGPTLAGALLVMGLLAAMLLALGVGSDRDDSLVVLPPASPAPSAPPPTPADVASPLRGTWQLDFEASGIEGWYYLMRPGGGGPRQSKMPVASSIEFADGVVSGGTGAGGGCDSFEGTYSDADGRLTIDLPTAAGRCGSGPVYPDLEVRQHLERTAARQVDGDELRLLDDDGALLLVYRRPPIDAP